MNILNWILKNLVNIIVIAAILFGLGWVWYSYRDKIIKICKKMFKKKVEEEDEEEGK